MKLIDKSALVAEIDKRIKRYTTVNACSKESDAQYRIKCHTLMSILSFLDTIDVLTLDDIKEMENQAFLHGIDVERNQNIFNDNKKIKI